jgi:hypothetical protein
MLSPYDFKKERSFYSKQVPQNVNMSTVLRVSWRRGFRHTNVLPIDIQAE